MSDQKKSPNPLSEFLESEPKTKGVNKNFTSGYRLHEQKKDTLHSYEIIKDLGQGTFGQVKLAIHRRSKEKVAIKILEKSRIVEDSDRERVSREIQILKILRHPSIAHLYEILEDKDTLYLVSEFIPNGELFDYIVGQRRIKEFEACKFFQQLIDGVEYIHRLNVVHRDLKPENLLLDENKNIKIVDFGLSNLYGDGQLLKTACGSPCYAAPEMIAGRRYSGLHVDIWSTGVILYAMICGYLPFDDDNTQKLYRKIMKGEYKLPSFVSGACADMLKNVLNVNPNKRYLIKDIKNHPWFGVYKGYVNIQKGLIVDYNEIPVDPVVIESVESYGYDREVIEQSVKGNRHNKLTTLYYLILLKLIKNGHVSAADISSLCFKPRVKGEIAELEEKVSAIVESTVINDDKDKIEALQTKETKETKDIKIVKEEVKETEESKEDKREEEKKVQEIKEDKKEKQNIKEEKKEDKKEEDIKEEKKEDKKEKKPKKVKKEKKKEGNRNIITKILNEHHKNIKTKTEKRNVNNLNNSTLLPFEEKIRDVSKSPKKKRRPAKSVIKNMYNSTIQVKTRRKPKKITTKKPSDAKKNELDISDNDSFINSTNTSKLNASVVSERKKPKKRKKSVSSPFKERKSKINKLLTSPVKSKRDNSNIKQKVAKSQRDAGVRKMSATMNPRKKNITSQRQHTPKSKRDMSSTIKKKKIRDNSATITKPERPMTSRAPKRKNSVTSNYSVKKSESRVIRKIS